VRLYGALIPVDTNVLVRPLTGDDRELAAAARGLFATQQVWIARTVLLETGWVLGSLYGFEESAIREAFTKLLGLRNVQVEDEPAMAAALVLTTHGIELADALPWVAGPRQRLCLLRSILHSPSQESRSSQRLGNTIPETLNRSRP